MYEEAFCEDNEQLKTDIHFSNFSRMNDTFRWRTLSLQSPFVENEIRIILVKPHV